MALVNPRPVVSPGQSTEARVVHLSSGLPSISGKGGKVQVMQGEGAQGIGAAPDSPEQPVVRRKFQADKGPRGLRRAEQNPRLGR